MLFVDCCILCCVIAMPTEASGSGGVSPVIWIGVPVVLASVGAGVFFWRKKKLGL